MLNKPCIDYSLDKNLQLKQSRGISFEEVVSAIEENRIIDVIEHPNNRKYSNQKMYVINIRISDVDLEHIKQKAAFEGISYQTLIASILHKYAAQHMP